MYRTSKKKKNEKYYIRLFLKLVIFPLSFSNRLYYFYFYFYNKNDLNSYIYVKEKPTCLKKMTIARPPCLFRNLKELFPLDIS